MKINIIATIEEEYLLRKERNLLPYIMFYADVVLPNKIPTIEMDDHTMNVNFKFVNFNLNINPNNSIILE